MEALALTPCPLLSHHHHHCRRISPLSFPAVHLSKHHLPRSHRRVLRPVKCCSAIPSPSLVDSSSKFAEASKFGNLIPLYRCIFSDHLTPVLAYRCLVKEDDREAPSFLFESVEPGFKNSHVGRYSIIGAQPSMEIVAKENLVTVMDHHDGKRTEEFVVDPMAIPRKIMEEWKPQLIDELPDVFCGGWVGYFSYDTVRFVEKKKLPFSSAPHDDRNLPDVHLGLYDDVIVFDHLEKKAYVIHWVRLDRFSSAEEAYKDGMDRLEYFLSRVHDVVTPRLPPGSIKLQTRLFGTSLNKSNMTSEEYKKAVLQAKEHILAGDIFQIVLSQRFERRTFADPFEVYRALRIVNPSPYMAYLQARGCILVASSPEILTRVKKGKITNRPLAGTNRRGKTPKEDVMLENQLLNDQKQRAEHIMLVDLGRNDVGKVSKFGSVKVEKLMNIERYSHVMHISSTVTGELLDHLASWDALRAALPVGTVSGAPKVPETLPERVLEKMKAPTKSSDVSEIKAEQLVDADGFLFGFPSRFGMMPAQFLAFFDRTGEIWASQSLAGKPAGIFWSTGFYGGGQENSALTAITQLSHHGMIYVPLGYTFGEGMFEMNEVKGGSSYGAGTFAGDGSRQPTQLELQQAFYQGQYVARVIKKLKS